MNTSFKIDHTFKIESKSLFVFAGEIINGTIKSGMNINIPFNEAFSMKCIIHGVEFIRSADTELVGLTVLADEPGDFEFLEQLDVAGETVEITSSLA